MNQDDKQKTNEDHTGKSAEHTPSIQKAPLGKLVKYAGVGAWRSFGWLALVLSALYTLQGVANVLFVQFGPTPPGEESTRMIRFLGTLAISIPMSLMFAVFEASLVLLIIYRLKQSTFQLGYKDALRSSASRFVALFILTLLLGLGTGIVSMAITVASIPDGGRFLLGLSPEAIGMAAATAKAAFSVVWMTLFLVAVPVLVFEKRGLWASIKTSLKVFWKNAGVLLAGAAVISVLFTGLSFGTVELFLKIPALQEPGTVQFFIASSLVNGVPYQIVWLSWTAAAYALTRTAGPSADTGEVEDEILV